MRVIHTFRFELERAFQAWMNQAKPTDENPRLLAAGGAYFNVGADLVDRVSPWNETLLALYPTPEAFDRDAQKWAEARAARKRGRQRPAAPVVT